MASDIDNYVAEHKAGDDCNKNVRVLILDPHCNKNVRVLILDPHYVINLIKGEYNN